MKSAASPAACEKLSSGISCGTEKMLLREETLTILLNGETYDSLVCTPADSDELVIGHLAAEGLISDGKDILSLRFKGENAYVNADVKKHPDAYAPESSECAAEDLHLLYDALQESPLYKATHSAHTAILMRNHEILCLRDDIGRHNAVDKALGYGLIHQIPLSECILFSSGRLPLDMVEKAIRAGVGTLASKSLPTLEAVERAKAVGLTIWHISSREGILRFS